MAAKLLIAKVAFFCEVDGKELLVHAGDRLRSDHPAVKGREQLFEPAEPRPDIEHAAAKSGKKRGQRKR